MDKLKNYPQYCRRNINKLMYMLTSDAETVYNMMRMTALLMDLDLDDEKVVEAILMDCGIEDAYI